MKSHDDNHERVPVLTWDEACIAVLLCIAVSAVLYYAVQIVAH